MNELADHDWSGGGFGKYKGLPLRQIQEHFDQCAADPTMRSISAVLRITREQLESRGDLGKQPYFMLIFGSIGVTALLGAQFLSLELKRTVMLGGGAFTFAAAAFAIGYLKTREARTMNLQQEREIRRAAAATIERILDHEPPLKPLQREQAVTLNEILKQEPQAQSLRKLIEGSGPNTGF